MSEWKTVRLGDVCEKGSSNIAQNEITDNNGEYPIYGAAGFIKNVDFYKQDKPYIGIVKDGAGVGRVSVHPAKSSLIGTMQYIFPKENIDIKFLAEFLKYQNLSRFYTGATIPHIYFKDYQNIPLKLPSLQKQKHISAVLDKCTALIAKHKLMLEKYDTLIKSRFIEMFGDNNFQKKKWNEIFITKTGKLDSNAMVEDGGCPFFTCEKEVFKIDTYEFDQEALLLAGNNAAGKYDVKHYKGKFNAYQRTYVLSLKEEWEYPLFKYQLEDKLEYLRQQSLGGLTKYLTLKILETLDFIVPPIGLQKKFTAFVQQIDKSKFAVQKSLEKTELLYKALMQLYFS